jgi:maltose-binding protein MalE
VAAVEVPTTTVPAALAPATYGGSGGPHLQVWWPNGSKDLMLDASAQAFLTTHPTWSIGISHTNGVDKFLTAEAAGAPPDAFLTTTDRMLQLAANATLLPLDSYLAADKVDRGQYFMPAVLGLPERPAPADVGLDPSKGPQSWDDFVTINQHLMKKNGPGLQRAGFVPT